MGEATKPKPKLLASDKQRQALAARFAKRAPLAKDIFRPAPPTPAPAPPVAVVQEPLPAAKPRTEPRQLNSFEIAGRARRAAQRERMHRVKVLLEQLIVLYPNCFKPSGEAKLPLKIGIHKDVMAAVPGLSNKDLKRAMAYYVRDQDYQRVMVKGATRVDLDGHPTTKVTKEETLAAKDRKAKVKRKPPKG